MPAKKSTSSKSTASKQKTTPRKKGVSPQSPSKSQAASPKTQFKKTIGAGECEVTIDRRTQADRREEDASPEKSERRDKVQRRRQIDPTTCERDYSVQEVEFMNAMDQYKRTSGRMFPTCSEVLEVIRGLGYAQLSPAELAILRPEQTEEPSQESGLESEESEIDLETETFECEAVASGSS